MSQSAIARWWFIGLLPLLAAHFYFARRVSEPYPAIIFPGFTAVPPHQGYPYDYEHLRVVGYTDTDSIQLSVDVLLAPVPYKARVFYPNLLDRVREVVPSSPNHPPSPDEQALALHFQQNLYRATHRSFNRVELQWYQNRATSPRDTHSVRLIDTRSISLNLQ